MQVVQGDAVSALAKAGGDGSSDSRSTAACDQGNGMFRALGHRVGSNSQGLYFDRTSFPAACGTTAVHSRSLRFSASAAERISSISPSLRFFSRFLSCIPMRWFFFSCR